MSHSNLPILQTILYQAAFSLCGSASLSLFSSRYSKLFITFYSLLTSTLSFPFFRFFHVTNRCPVSLRRAKLTQGLSPVATKSQHCNSLSERREITKVLSNQRAKKVVSDSPGLVDFAIGLVKSVVNLSDGQVMFFEEFE